MATKTNQKLLTSAEKLFWYHGHAGSSLDKIANDAGQSKGALFHYFRNKKDITTQVLEKYAKDQVFDLVAKHFDATPNTKEALLGWAMDLYQSYVVAEFKGGCLLGNLALELSDNDEQSRETLSSLFLEWENQLVGYFKDQSRRGEIVMEPRQFARLVIAMIQGITMTIKVHKDKNRAAREFQAFAELVERMIKG